MPNCFSSLFTWSPRRWVVAITSALATALVIGLPTAVIANPIFGRSIEVTSWSAPVLVITSLLSGLLVASYFRNDPLLSEERSVKVGGLGALLSYLAIGCPVCNKLALIALGSTGAIKYFAPVQPYLVWVGVLLLAYAVQKRLTSESNCKVSYVTESNKIEESESK